MTASIRLGLVGCGRLAEHGYLPAMAIAHRSELVAVTDPDEGRARSVGALAGASVRVERDLESMLHTGGLDAVVLASPADVHVDDAASVVAAGLPVLVEKPPAPDAVGAARLVRLGGTVRVGFNRRFDAGAAVVRAAVPAAGPVSIDAAIRYRRASWAPHTVRDDVLSDLAPHLVDWVRWLAGQEVVGVQAVEVSPDRAHVRLTTTRGSATITAAADRFHAESITVRGIGGAIVARHRAGGPVAAVAGHLPWRTGPHPLAASLAAQLDAFTDVVSGRSNDLLATATDGLRVMTVVDAARSSAAADGRRIDVRPIEEPISC